MSDASIPTGKAASSELVQLYDQAFGEFGGRALWNVRRFEVPTIEQVLAITRQLRIEGNMDACHLAERIEGLARADQ